MLKTDLNIFVKKIGKRFIVKIDYVNFESQKHLFIIKEFFDWEDDYAE
ncbi:TPA: hypothetical protein ACK3A9_005464 [Klebsiella pneumoniae]